MGRKKVLQPPHAPTAGAIPRIALGPKLYLNVASISQTHHHHVGYSYKLPLRKPTRNQKFRNQRFLARNRFSFLAIFCATVTTTSASYVPVPINVADAIRRARRRGEEEEERPYAGFRNAVLWTHRKNSANDTFGSGQGVHKVLLVCWSRILRQSFCAF